MAIEVVCPVGHTLRLKPEALGRRVTCPRCGQQFRVPSAGASVAERGRGGLPTAIVLALPAEVVAGLPRAVRLAPTHASGRPSQQQEPPRGPLQANNPAVGRPSVAVGQPGFGSSLFNMPPPLFVGAQPEIPPPVAPGASADYEFRETAARRARPNRAARQATGRRVREILAAIVILSVVAAVAAAAWWILDRRGFFKNLSAGSPAAVGLP